MRPAHWLKNLFVFAPLVFSGNFDKSAAWVDCLIAVGAFCLLSSAVYVMNDIFDRRIDSVHPYKRNRPIASGRLSVGAAMPLCLVLAAGGLALALLVSKTSDLAGMTVMWAGIYLFINLLYSTMFRSQAFIDVIIIAACFVLRAMAGAAAITVPISPWLVVCTFTLCLFLALSKRSADCEQTPESARPVYTVNELDRLKTISAALAIITYCIYCLAPRTVANIGSGHMIWTIPFVIYGIFRYDRTSRRIHRGDVVSVLLRDKILWLVILAYGALAAAVVRFGKCPTLSGILDVGEMLK